MYSTGAYDEEGDHMIANQISSIFLGRRTPIGAPKEQVTIVQHQRQRQQQPPHHFHHHNHDQRMFRNDMPLTQDHLFSPLSTEMMMLSQKRIRLQSGRFNRLSDVILLKIFSYLETPDLLSASQTCKRFETLCWNSQECWRTIHLRGEFRGDKQVKMIFKKLLVCGGHMLDSTLPFVERIFVSNGCKLTDKSLGMLSRRCPELTHLQVQSSNEIYDSGIVEVMEKCTNLQHLDLTGCPLISNLFAGQELLQRRFLLQYLDLTDCISITDCSLQNIVRHCPSLVYLYLRRCVQITDAGLKCIASYCASLRELSISDCVKVSDFGLYELAKLGAQLRYLSVAKCNLITDAGLTMIARRCYKLRYLNTRSCEAISDDSLTCIARCCRLRAIDIGSCDISDSGLKVLAESCPNLKKLSVRNCYRISDNGLNYVAFYCRGLQHLNIQDCQISNEGYRSVKMYCKRCVIEHTNPGFG